MSANRSLQLAKIKSLYELRVCEALVQLQEQQENVAALQTKVHEIERCADRLVEQLRLLDTHRLEAGKLTVGMLQDDAASRRIIELDLRKEQLYLETATNDVSEAMTVLTQKRDQWRERSQRLDALTALTQDQQKLELQQVQRLADRELDDQATNRHGVRSYG